MTKQNLIEAYRTLVMALEEADKRRLYGFDYSTKETRDKLLKTFDGNPTSDSRSNGLAAIFDLSSKENRETLVEIAPDDEKNKIEKLLQRLQGYKPIEVFNPASQPSIEVNAGDLADAIDTFAAVAKLYKGLVIWLRLKDKTLRFSCNTAGVQVTHSIAAKGRDWSLMLRWDNAGKLLQSVATRFGEKTERGKTLTLSRTPAGQECKFTVSWGRGSSSQVCLDAWDDNSEDAKRAYIEPPQGSEQIKITPLTMQRLTRLVKNAPYNCTSEKSYLCGPHFSSQKNSYGHTEIIVTDGHRFSIFSADFDGKNTLSNVTVPWDVFSLTANLDPKETITVTRFIDGKNDFIWFSDGKVSIMFKTLEAVTGMEYPAKFLFDLRDNHDGRLKPVNIERNHLLDSALVLKKSSQGFARVVISFLPDNGMFLYCDSIVEKLAENTHTISSIIKEKDINDAVKRLRDFGFKVEIKKQSDGQPSIDILPFSSSKIRKKITLTSEGNGPWLLDSRDVTQTSYFILWNLMPTRSDIDQRVGASIPASTYRGTSAYCVLDLSYLIEALKSFEDKNDLTTFEFPKDHQSPAAITIGSIRHFIMPIRQEGTVDSDFATQVARDALELGENDRIPFITEPSFGAAKTAKPKTSKPKPVPAPEDKPKTSKPKPVPAPEDKPKTSKPVPAPKVKTASQELEELAELVGGSEGAKMRATARAMREVEEIVRLAAEARALGLGSFANTMDDLAALLG